jgi:YrbI family 3-deoxy-D-manno-octulosonate 8-phosphate phosphatase
LRTVAREWNLPLEQVAYMGDDCNDLACLAAVGFAFCPQDAVPEISAIADYVAARPAGGGAVREVCDLLLAHRPDSNPAPAAS